jgi:predicted TIM-barrel fold metal-dependent hydrolase
LSNLSCNGVCLLSNYAGRYLGESDFAPILEELNRRRSIIFVHPTTPEPQAATEATLALLEFPFDTTRTIASLLFSGAFARYRQIRFIFAHAGGVAPFLAGRLARLEAQERFRGSVSDGVINELRRLYFDTALSVDPYILQGLLHFAAPAHILFGSDYPHAGNEILEKALAALQSRKLDPSMQTAIECKNAVQIFGNKRPT